MVFNSFPLSYNEPLFRPPSEAYSLILQITHGCKWNRCAFCEMYTRKEYYERPVEDVIGEIQKMKPFTQDTRKLFLADGNPLALETEKLLPVLQSIKKELSKIRQVSTYALPRDIRNKSIEELRILRENGLKLLYIGIESGDDELLKLINKGESFISTEEGLLKAKEAGIKLSVIILTGLGGKRYSEQHAVNSAKILNAIQPEFASSLVLSFPFGEEHYKRRFKGKYETMNIKDLLFETRTFITNTKLESTIYRSNHASNYLELEGILGRDKESFLKKINFALDHPNQAGLKPEWMRGL